MRIIQQSALGCSKENEFVDTKECLIDSPLHTSKTNENFNISWHSHLRSVPEGPLMIIGQEFLDTFPIHQFQRLTDGWKEVLVDVDNSADSNLHFRFVLSPKPTPAAHVMVPQRLKLDSSSAPAKLNLSSSSSSMHKLDTKKGVTDKDAVSPPSTNATTDVQTRALEGLEVSPLALAVVEDIAQRINRCGGCALLIDYGENFAQVNMFVVISYKLNYCDRDCCIPSGRHVTRIL